jgi:hypothetical protein
MAQNFYIEQMKKLRNMLRDQMRSKFPKKNKDSAASK